MKKTVLFDLDGTLLDTLGDLAAGVNHVLSGFSFPQRTREEIRSFIGNGVPTLLRRSLPAGVSEDTVSRAISDFTSDGVAHSGDNTVRDGGVRELRAALKCVVVNVGIVSNKKNEATRLICEKLLGGLYDYAHGAANEEERKPKPDIVYDAMAHSGASKNETVYVGDSNVDIETAWNAGIDCISVTWGYRDKAALEKAGATAFAEDAKQLPALLNAL